MAGYWRAIGSAGAACQTQGPTIPPTPSAINTLKTGFLPPYAFKPLIDLIFFEIQHVRPPQPTAAVRAADPGPIG